MKIVNTPMYEAQLKKILENIVLVEGYKSAKDFKLHLDTIIYNMPTKYSKYDESEYFEDVTIRNIPHLGFTVVFHVDEEADTFVILGIIKESS